MNRLTWLALAFGSLHGCIMYGGGECMRCKDRDGMMEGDHNPACQDPEDSGADDGGSGDGDADDSGGGGAADTGEPVELHFALDPATVLAGETSILSLTASQPFDFAAVVDLEFLGEVSICAWEPRDEELLLTVSTDKLVTSGPVDLLIRMASGDNHLLDDALTIEGGLEAGTEGDTGGAAPAAAGGCG